MLDLTEMPEPRTVRAADGRVTGYYEFGDPQGTPVVALHGTPACGLGFGWADDAARARGVRLLAPDRPGIGHSDDWRLGRPAVVGDYAPLLRAFADALGLGTFPVLGYSGGGPYALAAAHALAERVPAAAVVSGAGQIGVWASVADSEATDRLLTILSHRAEPIARATLAVGALVSRLAPAPSMWFGRLGMSAADRAVMARLGSPRAALAMFTEACRRGSAGVVDDYAALGRPWGFAIEEITARVHCWHAPADGIVPIRHSEELVRRIAGARLTRWEGKGHLAIVDHVGEVLDALLAP